MAGMKEIKTRIKSVENTKQITKAMELVSSSKFRKAKERAESTRAYFETLYETVNDIAKNTSGSKNVFLKERNVKKVCYIVIAGDRGLAGGYNSNIIKTVIKHSNSNNHNVIAIGKKANESLSKRGYNVVDFIESVEGASYEEADKVAKLAMEAFKNGEVDEVNLVYTKFVSALAQEPQVMKLLPVSIEKTEKKMTKSAVQYLPSADTVLGYILPKYISGSVYGAICESFASEQAARRTAMESATDNANEMISKLELVYNRARQAAVTQEISEIVAGASSSQ